MFNLIYHLHFFAVLLYYVNVHVLSAVMTEIYIHVLMLIQPVEAAEGQTVPAGLCGCPPHVTLPHSSHRL